MSIKRNNNLNVDDVCKITSKKHTLDSDEEDSDEYERDDVDDVDGEEDGVPNIRDDIKITPFNMREELEEGHFDKEGHYHWDKNSDIRDNWLDNIDWMKVDANCVKRHEDESMQTNASTKNDAGINSTYKQILQFMEKNETIAQTIRRLGKNRKKLSTAERIKNKKYGIKDDNADKIMVLTELVNHLLTTTGNMDVYEMTYEVIEEVASSVPGSSKTNASDLSLDMYSDDFNTKEKAAQEKSEYCIKDHEIHWEFKRRQSDVKCEGPYNTAQMLKLSSNGEFGSSGVYVRKIGEDAFYSSSRIDFDLYL
ncbi:CD2 antigen cytoplasmic tail-binding protein 2 homolog isoform X1 [Musca autumnalis]|uniref:CD2 antigen cytoplasmic tail-binding protein 2 homolog isoform X1 n=1 Tax=Musca autumnalis TaxID=221902 RepID=UPI003CF82AE0